MKTVITIEARMRSTRLPGKVLKPVLGRPMLEMMIERLRRVHQADAIVVATTDNPADDDIAALANRLGVNLYRGSEDDVLGRVLDAARSVEAELIAETTGDCPLIDPGIADQVIATFLTNQVDFCSSGLVRTYPLGLDLHVFRTSTLAEVAAQTQDPVNREHVALYIIEHPERFRLLNIASGLGPEVADLRLTVDTPEDYNLICRVFELLYPTNPEFGLPSIAALFAHQPGLREINRHIRQKAVR